VVDYFDDDDERFFHWVACNPDGYVVNMHRRHKLHYVVLHRAGCRTLKSHRNMESNPGGFTERGYVKVCSQSTAHLERFLAAKLGTSKRPVFSKRCSLCDP